MAYVKILIHAVWGTKNHHPFLTKEIKQKVISHIKENGIKKQICIDRLNGHTEHMHCLFWLNADMSVAKALQLLKGESAHWVNKEKLFKSNFEWADEYYSVSISESQINNLRRYIDGQEVHHEKVTFKEEYDEFIKYNNLNSHG